MSLRQTLERIRSNPVPTNEETAKARILTPVLSELGWDPVGTEILWEHPVGDSRDRGRVDIALRAEERILALIEAKTPGADLGSHVGQVLKYAFHEGVDICVLTDGLLWWLYLPREPGQHKERRFAVLNVKDDPLDRLSDDLVTFLGRESLLSGQAEQRAKQVLRALLEAAELEKRVPGIWQRMVDEPDAELVELISQRVYDQLSLRPQHEQIVAAIRGMPIPPAPSEPDESAVPPSPKPAATPNAKRPTAIRLWGEPHPIRFHYETVTTVLTELHKRHPDRFDQAAAQLKSRNWSYVSRDRQQVRNQRIAQIPSGHYVDVNLSAAASADRCRRILEAFGYSESDLELLYEDVGSSQPPAKLPSSPPAGRPTAIRLWGELHPVRQHREVLMTVAAQLQERHPDDFDRIVEQFKSSNWQYVSRDRQRMHGRNTKQIPSGHYVDVHLSAADVRKRSVRLLELFGYGESDLEYLYEG